MNKKNLNDAKVEEILSGCADNVNAGDIDDILGKEDEIKKLFKRVNVLAKFFNDLCEIFELLRDRVAGLYTETPWRTVAALTGALIYVLLPVDLIFDFIPLIGFLDDAAVIGLAVKICEADLEKYREWKAVRQEVVI